MTTQHCPYCQGEIQQEEGRPIRFCPFCGKSLGQAASTAAPSKLAQQLDAEKQPKKKYALIQAALQANPDDFDANRALLFHGRLHEAPKHGKRIIFSNIKCYLFSAFDPAAELSAAERDAMVQELLHDAQLAKTLSLAPDADAFLVEYLHTLAHQYVDLFLRGDSRNSTVMFGFPRSPAATAQRCAGILRQMFAAIAASPALSDAERLLLLGALRDGYEKTFPGYATSLDG